MEDWEPPAEFEEYVVARPLGRGAMGQVWLAEDTLLNRAVAIKFVTGEVDEETRRRFFIEARAIARLSHPNVVAVYRVGELKRRPYLVSELIRGVSLDRVEKPVPAARLLEVAVGLARGLSAAHRRGVLHRDLKPPNAMLTDEGEVKLLDFGLARLTDDPTAPRSGEVLGSPLYMAPETWRGEPPSKRMDVYGLGALLYELGCGRAPHAGASREELARLAQEVDARPLAEAQPGSEPRLSAIIDRCLARDPAARFESGDALREALERLLAGAGGPAPDGNPYRGLQAFEAEHRALFFGRGAEIRAIVERLRSEPLVLVAGDSGVGKSSLCRAGVAPLLAEGALGRPLQPIVLVPGRRPLAALCAQLAPLTGESEASLAARLRDEPAALGRALRRRDTGVLLLVDQLEELVTLADPEEARLTAEVLGALALPAPNVRLLMTARGDFLGRLAALPGLGPELSRALYLLPPLSPEGVREAIAGPAATQGVSFEPPALIDRLAQAAAGGGLPLLSFALAELWERRDVVSRRIDAATLERLGGTDGALARHGDQVLARLPPAERAAARPLLCRLVTAEGTRSRRTLDELAADAPSRAALEALVRGRLVVAREGDAASGVYELAHEALIGAWDTLRGWLSEDAGERALRQRLERAAAEWERLGRTKDALLGPRQLAEAAALFTAALPPREAALLAASRRAARARTLRRWTLVLAAPAMLGVALGAARLQARRAIDRNVDGHVREAEGAAAAARAEATVVDGARARAFAQFDAQSWSEGERAWAEALAHARDEHAAWARASGALEAALALDPARAALRARFADVTLARALAADRDHQRLIYDELVARLALYDDGGERRRQLDAPATLAIAIDPPGAAVAIERYEDRDHRRVAVPVRPPGPTPVGDLPLPPGSYLLDVSAAGRAPVRYPVLLARGERLPIRLALPRSADVPDGFVYVPPGRFLFGTDDDESVRRGFLRTAPQHPVTGSAYLIARHEVTFADWITWLRALPPAERARRLPNGKSAQNAIALHELPDGRFQLELTPTTRAYVAAEGEPIRYPERDRRASQDWRRFPVSGVSFDDAIAYAAWLDETGRVRGARLCDEYEWERAARGADNRIFPAGDRLQPDDADYDESYGRRSLAFGPDEVGAHPASRSPFGVDDLAGNVWEWVRSVARPGEVAYRGGSWYQTELTARSNNRQVGERAVRHAFHGVRLCATPR